MNAEFIPHSKTLFSEETKSADPPLWEFALLGVLLGLAALSKLSGLGLLGLTGLTLLWQGWKRRSWRTAILGNVIIVAIAAAVAGWGYWRNLALYGEWSGTQNMVQMMGPRAVLPTTGQLLAEVPGMMRSFWGLFGGLSVPLPAVVYRLLNALLIIGLGGLVAAMFPHRTQKLPPGLRHTWPVLAGWLLLLVIGLVQWTLRTPATQGRLLFPGMAALAPLWAAGQWVHGTIGKPTSPAVLELDVPSSSTADGELILSWRQPPGGGGNGRGAQVAEVWLTRK